MKKKILSTLLAILGISLTGFVLLSFLGLFNEQESGILVESNPNAKVYIDNVEVGSTPYESNLKAKEITLKIKPSYDGLLVMDDYETKINLVPGIRTIVKRTFGFDDESTSGVVVSFEKIGGQSSFVTVVSTPDNAEIVIDNRRYGYTPLRVNLPAGDHTLSVVLDGYIGKTLPIKVYKGFKLTASVKLAKSEVVERQELAEVLSVETASLSMIKINKTDIGFLRVRSGANTGFPEVGQVKPNERYDVIEEGENGKWFKIRFLNTEGVETEGWVAAEFVTKI